MVYLVHLPHLPHNTHTHIHTHFTHTCHCPTHLHTHPHHLTLLLLPTHLSSYRLHTHATTHLPLLFPHLSHTSPFLPPLFTMPCPTHICAMALQLVLYTHALPYITFLCCVLCCLLPILLPGYGRCATPLTTTRTDTLLLRYRVGAHSIQFIYYITDATHPTFIAPVPVISPVPYSCIAVYPPPPWLHYPVAPCRCLCCPHTLVVAPRYPLPHYTHTHAPPRLHYAHARTLPLTHTHTFPHRTHTARTPCCRTRAHTRTAHRLLPCTTHLTLSAPPRHTAHTASPRSTCTACLRALHCCLPAAHLYAFHIPTFHYLPMPSPTPYYPIYLHTHTTPASVSAGGGREEEGGRHRLPTTIPQFPFWHSSASIYKAEGRRLNKRVVCSSLRPTTVSYIPHLHLTDISIMITRQSSAIINSSPDHSTINTTLRHLLSPTVSISTVRKDAHGHGDSS